MIQFYFLFIRDYFFPINVVQIQNIQSTNKWFFEQ